MPDYSTTPSHRVVWTHNQARLDNRDFNVTTEAGAREALARVNVLGTLAEKTTVRAAVAKFWPSIGKPSQSGDTRDLFPNSNMNR